MARILTNISLTRRKDIKIQLIHSFSFHIHNIWKANKLFAQETTAKFCQVSSFVIHHRGTIVTCNKLFLLLAKLNRCIDGKNFLKKSSVFFLFLFFFSLEEFFELTFFSSPSFTRLSPSSLFQWHDTLLNFSLNRGNSVPPLSPLFFLSLPPPYSSIFSLSSPVVSRYLRSIRSLCREILFLLPLPLDLAPKQFNQSLSLFRVRPISLSPAEAFLLFALELAAIPWHLLASCVILDKRKFE